MSLDDLSNTTRTEYRNAATTPAAIITLSGLGCMLLLPPLAPILPPLVVTVPFFLSLPVTASSLAVFIFTEMTDKEKEEFFNFDKKKEEFYNFVSENAHVTYDFVLNNIDEILAITSVGVSYSFANLLIKDIEPDVIIRQNIRDILLNSTPLPEAIIDSIIIPSSIDSIIDRNIADREIIALMLSGISGLSTIGALKIKSYFIEAFSNEDQCNELVGMNSTISNEDVEFNL